MSLIYTIISIAIFRDDPDLLIVKGFEWISESD